MVQCVPTMKTLTLVIVAVSLEHKALSFAGRPPPPCRFERNRNDVRRSKGDVRTFHSPFRSSSHDRFSYRHALPKIILRGGHSGTNTEVPSRQYLGTSSSSSTEVKSYYLIWSRGFWQRFVWMIATLWGMHLLQWDARLSQMVAKYWQVFSSSFPVTALQSSQLFIAGGRFAPNVLLPLLGSSCCLIQLVINVLVGAGGCAGFNTILGPVRPLFLAILVMLNIVTGASLRQSLWRYSIALLPEGVHFWNGYKSRQWSNRVASITSNVSSERRGVCATILVDIPTMGCVACIHKIESNLRSSAPNHVVTASSWLEKNQKGGYAKLDVCVDSESELQVLSQSVVKTIENAGFLNSQVTNVEITPAVDVPSTESE
jgi:hypothetical protein